MSEGQYADSILKDEFSGPSKSNEIVNGQYWLPPEWNFEYIDGRPLDELVRQSLANPFSDYNAARRQLWNNPMFQAAVRLAYWVATHIPYNGSFNKYPDVYYGGCVSCCYYEGPAAVLLHPDHGWNCADHAVLTVALYRAAGIPGYVVYGWWGEQHAWTAVFVYDEKSGKWHEIFIDPVEPEAHEVSTPHMPGWTKITGRLKKWFGDYEFISSYYDKPYEYVARFGPFGVCWLLEAEETEIKRAGVNIRYWKTRVDAFRGWSVSSSDIDAAWNSFKHEWREVHVKETKSRSATVAVGATLAAALLPVWRRRLLS